MTVEELGVLYEEKRRAWEEATGAEGTGNEYVMEVARRLGLEFDPPGYSPGGGRYTAGGDRQVHELVCDRCGVHVEHPAVHTRWHELVSAGIKCATYEANLGHLGAVFLGISLREILERPDDDDDRPGDGWADSGHGHVYPREDGVRARCGGPAMCKACAADLAHAQAARRSGT